MSYPKSAYFSPTSPQYKWDERDKDRQYHRDDRYSRPHGYPTPPPTASSESFASLKSPKRYVEQRRPRWPPSPWVEDESKSLSRERNPSVSSDDTVPLRGSQDQYPIILEANAGSESESENVSKNNFRRTDSSSTDSSGPRTPGEGTRGDERRFVLVTQDEGSKHEQQEKEQDHIESEDGRRGSYVRLRPRSSQPELEAIGGARGKSPAPARSPAGPNLTIDSTLREKRVEHKKDDPLPYTGPRESMPYSYSPNPDKGTFAPEQMKPPPETTTPTSTPQSARGRQYDLRSEGRSEPRRTYSSSSTLPSPKVASPRHMSAMGLSRENTRSSYDRTRGSELKAPFSPSESKRNISPLSSSQRSRPAIESDSEYTESDSDISPDDDSPPHRRKRNTRYSMSKRQAERHASSPQIEPMRKPRPEFISIPPSRSSQSLGAAAKQPSTSSIPKSPSTSNLAPRGKVPEMQQKMPNPHIRPSSLTSPYKGSPPPSPNREAMFSYFTSPTSTGNLSGPGSLPNSRPGSRSSSRPNSRPNTPPYPTSRKAPVEMPQEPRLPYPTSRQGTLEMPEEPTPGSSSSYARPVDPTSQPQFSALDVNTPTRDSFQPHAPRSRQTSPLPVLNPEQSHTDSTKVYSEPEPLDPRAKTFPIDSSGRKSRESSTQSGQSSQTSRPVQVPYDGPSRKSMESQHSAHGSIDGTPRTPSIFKPTLRKRPATTMPVLPRCPRPNLVEGYNDWSTLPGHPYFDVCPTCRKALEEGGFSDQFVPSAPRQANRATRCDLSNTWVRMAWILLMQDKAKDRSIVNSLTTVHYNEPPCPGRHLTVRTWFRVYDPDTGRSVSGFDACPVCVRSLESLFPALRGSFYQDSGSESRKPRTKDSTCDLRTDSHRFPKYVDLLERIAATAEHHRREPDLHRFIQLARKMAAVAECAQDTQLLNVAWHYPPHAPDFTVCEECYADVVRPALQSPVPGVPIGDNPANMFCTLPQKPPSALKDVGLSCQLYSPRMREAFREAAKKGDVRGLREKALARVAKERELQRRHREIQNWKHEEDRVEEGRKLVREWGRWA